MTCLVFLLVVTYRKAHEQLGIQKYGITERMGSVQK